MKEKILEILQSESDGWEVQADQILEEIRKSLPEKRVHQNEEECHKVYNKTNKPCITEQRIIGYNQALEDFTKLLN